MSVWVKSLVEDSQPVKHNLDLVISPSPQVVEQVDQSLHDDSFIPLWIIIQAVENWTIGMTYNFLHCKCLFESDHLK